MDELRLSIATPEGRAPLLCLRDRSAPRRGTVLLYHGLGASKEVQRKELGWLAGRGFLAVGVDVVGHGEREPENCRTLEFVARSIDELPAVVDGLWDWLGDDGGRLAVVGISLGGFVAFGAVLRERRLKASVSILGSPDWESHAGEDRSAVGHLLGRSPHRFPQRFAPTAMLAANAGQDKNVPPAPARRFTELLRDHYQDPGSVGYLEYPESGHFMREQDWDDLWSQTMGFLDHHLNLEPGGTGRDLQE